MAESLQPKEIEDNFKYLFKFDIYDFALSHRPAFDLQVFSYSSRFRIFVKELVFSRIILSFCSMLFLLTSLRKSLIHNNTFGWIILNVQIIVVKPGGNVS